MGHRPMSRPEKFPSANDAVHRRDETGRLEPRQKSLERWHPAGELMFFGGHAAWKPALPAPCRDAAARECPENIQSGSFQKKDKKACNLGNMEYNLAKSAPSHYALKSRAGCGQKNQTQIGNSELQISKKQNL
jgi:hypothetical protein